MRQLDIKSKSIAVSIIQKGGIKTITKKILISGIHVLQVLTLWVHFKILKKHSDKNKTSSKIC
jgi:hypothetical protein